MAKSPAGDGAGVAALAAPLAVGMLTPGTEGWRLRNRSGRRRARPSLSFEVASIKPNNSSEPEHWNIATGLGDFMRPVGNLYTVSNMPLREIIGFAYKLAGNMQYLMIGLPSWVNTQHYDIEAKAAEGTPKKDEFRLMMQSLLADRFKTSMHGRKRGSCRCSRWCCGETRKAGATDHGAHG